MTSTDPQKKKKPKYQRPEIRVHGNLRQLTQTKGGTKADGGGANPRTRV